MKIGSGCERARERERENGAEKKSRRSEGKTGIPICVTFFANLVYKSEERAAVCSDYPAEQKKRTIQTVKLYQVDSKCHLITAVINLSESLFFSLLLYLPRLFFTISMARLPNKWRQQRRRRC